MIAFVKNKNITFCKENNKPILVITAQKSGTHLITNILNLAGFKKGEKTDNSVSNVTKADLFNLKPKQYLHSHQVPANPVYSLIEEGKIYCIFNYRDPRDVIVSNYFWLATSQNELSQDNITGKFLRRVYSEIADKKEIIEMMIKCEKMYPGEQTLYDWFYKTKGLFFHPNVFKTRFEDLIGSKGGGSDIKQKEILKKLFEYLSIDADIEKIRKQAFDPSQRTFRRGQIGDYKKHLNKKLIKLFNDKHKDILKTYHYKMDTKSK